MNLSDRVFIERYFSLGDVGIYAVGRRVASLTLVVMSGFTMAYNPIFFELASSPDQGKARKTLSTYNNAYALAVLGICFATSLLAKEAIEILLDPKFVDAYKMVPIFAVIYFVGALSGLQNLSLYQEKKTFANMVITVGGAIVNVSLNFLVVPRFGPYGAAVVGLLSVSAVFTAQYWYAKRCYFIPLRWRTLTVAFSLALTAFLVISALDLSTYLSLAIKLALLLIVFAALAVRFRSLWTQRPSPETEGRTD